MNVNNMVMSWSTLFVISWFGIKLSFWIFSLGMGSNVSQCFLHQKCQYISTHTIFSFLEWTSAHLKFEWNNILRESKESSEMFIFCILESCRMSSSNRLPAIMHTKNYFCIVVSVTIMIKFGLSPKTLQLHKLCSWHNNILLFIFT